MKKKYIVLIVKNTRNVYLIDISFYFDKFFMLNEKNWDLFSFNIIYEELKIKREEKLTFKPF